MLFNTSWLSLTKSESAEWSDDGASNSKTHYELVGSTISDTRTSSDSLSIISGKPITESCTDEVSSWSSRPNFDYFLD